MCLIVHFRPGAFGGAFFLAVYLTWFFLARAFILPVKWQFVRGVARSIACCHARFLLICYFLRFYPQSVNNCLKFQCIVTCVCLNFMPLRFYLFFILFCVAGFRLSASELSLRSAVVTALEHNLDLRVSTYTPANALDSVVVQEAQFDPTFYTSASLSERQSAAASSSLDSASIPESETRGLEAGVTQSFSTGASVTLDSSISRSASNNNAARNPDYSSDVGVSITQPLLKDAWSTVNLAPLARAKVTAERSLFILRSDVLDLLLETELAYWNLAYARESRELALSSLELAQNLLDENRERERLGLVTRLEVLQAEAELSGQQEAIIEAERDIEDAEDALRRAMGQANFLENLSEDALVVADLPEVVEPLRPMQRVVQDTVTYDVDAKAQELQVELERIDRILAQDETRPDLDLSAGLTYLGRDDQGSAAYRGAYEASGYNWNLGLKLSMPWGFREARAEARQAERNLEQAKLQLYNIKQEKALAARNAWRSAQASLKRIEVARATMLLNQEAFEQERARYGSGLVPYRSVLEAQRDYDAAKSNYLSSLIETLRARARLSRVDGTLLSRNGFDWDEISPYTQVTVPNIDFELNPATTRP
jgi:outer membrane protein TolC